MSGEKFSRVEEEQLVAEVAKHSLLYTPSHVLYKNQLEREKAWTAIARKLEKSGNACKSRWRNLRDTYKKTKRANEFRGATFTAASNRKRNPVLDQLRFLEAVEDERRGQSNEYPATSSSGSHMFKEEPGGMGTLNPGYFGESSYARQMANAVGNVDLLGNEASFARPKTNRRSRKRRKATDEVGKSMENQSEMMTEVPESLMMSRNVVEDEIDLFCNTIGQMLKKFPPYTLAQAKSQIFNLVSQLEMELLHPAHPAVTFN